MKKILVVIFFILVMGFSNALYEWWNSSWHYRYPIIINSTNHSRNHWPIELELNFTKILWEIGYEGNFDLNSTRVIEYSSSGSVLREVSSQFEKNNQFNAYSDASGTLVFIMNGTTSADSVRYYFVYFDVVENGNKTAPNYALEVNASEDNGIITVNNSILHWYIDLARGENSSGLYKVEYWSSVDQEWINLLVDVGEDERTIEYTQYSNGSENFSFDFSNVKISIGPIRTVVELVGNETIWGKTDIKTGEGMLSKKYFFYANSTSIKVFQNYSNKAGYVINRSSTYGGALFFDSLRSWGINYQAFGFPAEPHSFAWSLPYFGGHSVEIINFNQSESGFYVVKDANNGIGLTLKETQVPVGGTFWNYALMNFSYIDVPFDLNESRNAFVVPLNISLTKAEREAVGIKAFSNHVVYNRNETILVYVDLSDDPYGIATHVNASFDLGTTELGDDLVFELFDENKDKIFNGSLFIWENASIGVWNVSIRVYSNGSFINSSQMLFNVSDWLNVNVSVVNPIGVVGRQVNASMLVSNYRNDSLLSGANFYCVFNGTQATDVIDYGNGSYLVTFFAPAIPSTNYFLNCTASKSNNTGYGGDSFSADEAKINTSILLVPNEEIATGITQTRNYSFVFYVKASNTGEGTIHYANISIHVLSGWWVNSTKEECGDVPIGGYCVKAFNVTVPNATAPGNYLVNATVNWINPDESFGSNSSSINVTVSSNPVIELFEERLSSFLKPGVEKNVGNFTILSTGNDFITGISFSKIDFGTDFSISFFPESISSIAGGQNYSVQINASSIASPGVYLGRINVSTENAGYILFYLELNVSGTSTSIELNATQYSAINVTNSSGQNFAFYAKATNTGNITAFYSNITIEAPTGWGLNSSSELCGNLSINSSCTKAFLFSIPAATPPGEYSLNISFNWFEPEIGASSNKTFLNVIVEENPILGVLEKIISANGTHGSSNNSLGNFTILSLGNYLLNNVSISLDGLNDFNVTFSVSNISTLGAGEAYLVKVNFSIPLFYEPGVYDGFINLNSENGGNASLSIQINVSPTREWSMSPKECYAIEAPDVGEVCSVLVNNSGNALITFSITPSNSSYTNNSRVNASYFVVPKNSTYLFKVVYNVSGKPKDNYYTNFTVDALEGNAVPGIDLLQVTLTPAGAPTISIEVIPNASEQLGSFQVFVNTTDHNLIGMYYVQANITSPDGISYVTNMSLVGFFGNTVLWYLDFPGAFGDSSKRGIYSIEITAVDNAMQVSKNSSTFSVYTTIFEQLYSLYDKYYQGDAGSIYFKATDALSEPLMRVKTRIVIRDKNSTIVYNNSFETDSEGLIQPLPRFELASDAILGNYTIHSYSKYFDEAAGIEVSSYKNYSFEVLNGSFRRGSGGEVDFKGLFGEIESLELWFSGDNIQFTISARDANGTTVEPDLINFTVLAPSNNPLFSVPLSSLSRISTGVYRYNYSNTGNIELGSYLAMLNMSKGNYTSQSFKAFRITSSLLADLETSLLFYPPIPGGGESKMKFEAMVYTTEGRPIDPDEMNLTVYDPDNDLYFKVGLNSFTKKATGYYEYKHTMAGTIVTGIYLAYLNLSKQNYTSQKVKMFRVSSGGPYDLKINLLTPEVKPGEYADFEVTIINMGELNQDVSLEYWISGGTEAWYYNSEALYVAAKENKTISRSAYVYSDQPFGTYSLNVKLVYDLSQPPIQKNTTLRVVSGEATPVPGTREGGSFVPVGGGFPNVTRPSPTPVSNFSRIEFVEVPEEIVVEKTWSRYPIISIKNTGNTVIKEIKLLIFGIPESWIEIKPSNVSFLAPNESVSFLVKISVPKNADPGVRKIIAVAQSNETRAETIFTLTIFESLKEQLAYEIDKAMVLLNNLIKDTKEAQETGKEVDEVWSEISKAQEYLEQARNLLNNDRLEDASSTLNAGKNTIERARYLLAKAKFIQKPVEKEVTPAWLVLLVIFLIIALVTVTLLLLFKRRKEETKPNILVAKKAAKELEADFERLSKEKEKAQRVLRLLEEEYNQGIISQKAFAELKKRNEEKIAEIEKRLKNKGS